MIRFAVCIAALAVQLWAAGPYKTKNVILVTADGLRWQEVFGGIDPSIPNKNPVKIGNKREDLMPFLWGEIAKRGVILRARVTNAYRVSYPGYSEILTGRAQDEAVRGNDPIQNPTPTVLEFVRERLHLPASGVALFGSWDTFSKIGEHTPGAVTINAGYQRYTAPNATPRLKELSRMQFELLTPFPEVRHDYITFHLADEYRKAQRPRLLHIALGETDDWAHEERYDRYLETAHYFDQCLRDLWAGVDQADTTLIVTSDHGRGGTPADWGKHGNDIAGADRIWIAIIGPDTPATGEVSSEVAQRDVAPTILELLGIDYRAYTGVLGSPIRAAIVQLR